MTKQYLKLKDVRPYVHAFHLSNLIWDMVQKWSSFDRYSIGKQFVEAADSISANIAEGFGRYHKKDKTNFLRYARGSTYETLDWLQKAKTRSLVSEEQYARIFNELSTLPKEINGYIKPTASKLAK